MLLRPGVKRVRLVLWRRPRASEDSSEGHGDERELGKMEMLQQRAEERGNNGPEDSSGQILWRRGEQDWSLQGVGGRFWIVALTNLSLLNSLPQVLGTENQ